MTTDANIQVQDAMRGLRVRYLIQLEERLQSLIQLKKKSEIGTLQDNDRQSLQFLAHKLAGSGTTFGFPAISEAGRILEVKLIEQPLADREMLMPLLLDLIRICTEARQSAIEENPQN